MTRHPFIDPPAAKHQEHFWTHLWTIVGLCPTHALQLHAGDGFASLIPGTTLYQNQQRARIEELNDKYVASRVTLKGSMLNAVLLEVASLSAMTILFAA